MIMMKNLNIFSIPRLMLEFTICKSFNFTKITNKKMGVVTMK